MKIKVIGIGTLRKYLGSGLVIDISGDTVQGVIYQLISQCGEGLKTELFDENGNLEHSYGISVNGRLAELSDKVKNGDELLIFSAMGGG